MLKPYNVIIKSYYKDKLNCIDTATLLLEEPIESERIDGPWKIITTSGEKTSISMEELMKCDAELVIQYLKERGITTCPMNF